ncbi:DUF167 domain-containing protein [Microbacterium sp. NIBRBAC000506063]|uniref:DUF167 domain-containing protein n=1 Tax=Microbacterium sp. NIBRBAC000506063 TaxID=2734618 RepID=UPI001CB6F938|nr:DUF167 domain-containing protein [Microbacterium sp. NIBRBAC000506063]
MQYTVRVKPGSKKGPLVEEDEKGDLTVFVRERAVDGAANKGSSGPWPPTSASHPPG